MGTALSKLCLGALHKKGHIGARRMHRQRSHAPAVAFGTTDGSVEDSCVHEVQTCRGVNLLGKNADRNYKRQYCRDAAMVWDISAFSLSSWYMTKLAPHRPCRSHFGHSYDSHTQVRHSAAGL